MHVSSRDLARALVLRLNEVVPAPFRLNAEDGHVNVFIGDEWDSMLLTPDIVEDETREPAERLWTAVYAVLDSVQDSVSEYLRIPWPSLDGVTMTPPGVRVDPELVHLWYGADESAPVVSMPAIRISEVARTDRIAKT